MTDATFRTRSVRALAVAGVIGLMASPFAAPRAYAAKGDVKIAAVGEVPADSNDPHIKGCDFQVIAFNLDKGTYAVQFTPQNPKPAGVNDGDYGFSGPSAFVIPSDGTKVTNTFSLIPSTGKTLPPASFHLKVQVGDKVDSKVFWLDGCTAKAPTVPEPEPTSAAVSRPSFEPTSEPSSEPSGSTASVPGKVNSGLEADSVGGLIALGVGGVAIAGLGALGLRRRGR